MNPNRGHRSPDTPGRLPKVPAGPAEGIGNALTADVTADLGRMAQRQLDQIATTAVASALDTIASGLHELAQAIRTSAETKRLTTKAEIGNPDLKGMLDGFYNALDPRYLPRDWPRP